MRRYMEEISDENDVGWFKTLQGLYELCNTFVGDAVAFYTSGELLIIKILKLYKLIFAINSRKLKFPKNFFSSKIRALSHFDSTYCKMS